MLARRHTQPAFTQWLQDFRLAIIQRIGGLIGEHHPPDCSARPANSRRRPQIDRQRHGPRDPLNRIFPHGFKPGLVGMAVDAQILAESAYRIMLPPCIDLVTTAIRRGVAGRMTAVAIRYHIQHRRTAALEQQRFFAARGIGDRKRIVAIDSLAVHRIGINAQTNPRQHAKAERLALRLPAHAVKVVHEIEKYRWRAAQVRVPERAVLIHRREIHRLPHGPAGGR